MCRPSSVEGKLKLSIVRAKSVTKSSGSRKRSDSIVVGRKASPRICFFWSSAIEDEGHVVGEWQGDNRVGLGYLNGQVQVMEVDFQDILDCGCGGWSNVCEAFVVENDQNVTRSPSPIELFNLSDAVVLKDNLWGDRVGWVPGYQPFIDLEVRSTVGRTASGNSSRQDLLYWSNYCCISGDCLTQSR